jgi:hypothetical protein
VVSPAQVLPTTSAVIRECVRQVRKLIAAGILRWPLREGQGLDSQDSKDGLAAYGPQGAGRSVPRPDTSGRSPRNFPTNCLRAAAAAAGPAGSVAGARPSLFYASSITSFRFPFATSVPR